MLVACPSGLSRPVTASFSRLAEQVLEAQHAVEGTQCRYCGNDPGDSRKADHQSPFLCRTALSVMVSGMTVGILTALMESSGG